MDVVDINPECSFSKLGKCEVCSIEKAKYTCPQCEVKTCSLKCNKIHKSELECNGQRNFTKFIPVNRFSNLDLLSDYRLLENISRSLETSKKKFGRQWRQSDYLMKLRNAAKSRKINLKFLPFKFERRRTNTSWFKLKDNTIHWHIEWLFVNADNIKLCDQRISENDKIGTVLTKYFEMPQESPLYEKLQFYQAVGLPGVRVFLKAEQRKGNKYFEVNANSTIKETLCNKVIIEYPTFYVVLRDHGSSFDVVDSDDEGEVERTGNQVIANIIKKAEENNSMKNLLFVPEEELSSD